MRRNTILKKITCYGLLLMIMSLLLVRQTQAAGGLSISASSSAVSEGGTFTVTVKAGSDYFVAGLNLSVSGGTIVENLGRKSLDQGETTTARIKLTGDSCVVSVSGTAASYTTETEGSASASVTVKKKAASKPSGTTTNKPSGTTANQPTKSSDNKLSSITLSEGTLSPIFDPGTTSYKVELPSTAATVRIDAKANDSKASVTGTGEKTLNAGDNVIELICTAENGSANTYTVNVYVDETPFVYTTYGEDRLGVVRNQTNIGIPATYEEVTVDLEEQEVLAYHSGQSGLTIVYLVDETGEKNFYIFEEEKGITSVFRPVSLLGRNLILYDLTDEEQIREYMTMQELTIDGISVKGWVYDVDGYEDYALIPVMNEFGEKVIYQYEKTENTLQLYKEFVEPLTEEPEERTKIDILYLYIAAAAAGVFLLTTVVLLIMNRRRKRQDWF